ncbi:MAG: PAS domain-containing methyl-accepting chemotaxis protein, partial [Gammaproteobacteria bacterium]
MRKNLPVTGHEVDYPPELTIVSITDAKGRIQAVNEGFISVSGFSADALQNQAHNIVRHPDMPPQAFADLWATLARGESWLGLVKNRCANGDHYWVEAFVAPIVENGVTSGYQSVRTRPARAAVARAESVYARLREARGERWLLRGLRYRQRLMLGALAALVPALGAIVAAHFAAPALVCAGLALISAVLLAGGARHAARPLEHLAADAREVFSNPLARRVISGRNDEIGDVALALAMQRARLRTLVGRTDEAATEVAQTAQALANSTTGTATNLDRQRSELAQIAAAMEQMSTTVGDIARTINIASEAARNAATSTDGVRQATDHTRAAIAALQEEVVSSAGVIAALAAESQDIGAVLEVIRGIAEQTNLLALNAAIEAARAGESGRGFAVVADEVRSLATRTAESTAQIDAMIARFRQEAGNASRAIEAAQSSATTGVAAIARAAGQLGEITDAVGAIRDMTVQIATAAE